MLSYELSWMQKEDEDNKAMGKLNIIQMPQVWASDINRWNKETRLEEEWSLRAKNPVGRQFLEAKVNQGILSEGKINAKL